MKKPLHLVVSNAAEKSAKIYLYGIIGDGWSDSPLTAKGFVRSLTSLEGQGIKRVDVHVNSPGGDVWDGLGISNGIKSSKMDVHTYNDGLCASMGSGILCSAKKENRHAAKGSVTMIHNASTIAWGNSKEMRETADFLDTHDTVLAGIYADAMGKPADEIQSTYFNYKDHWFTAQQAEALGLFTIENYEAEQIPEDVTNMPFEKVAAYYRSTLPTNLQNPDMSLINFNNPYKGLSALAKVAAADVTAEQLKAVNEELKAEGINGLSVVKDADMQETVEAAAKVEGLEAEIVTLKASADKVAGLEAQIAEQKKKLDAVVVSPTAPVTTVTDVTPAPVVVEDTFETSFDRELKAQLGK